MAKLTAPPPEPRDFADGISKRVLRLLRAQAEDRHDVCRRLSDWEDQYLVGQAANERLAEHAHRLDELEWVGCWFSLVSQSPDFPDPATAELVAMTLRDLKDARALWHGKMGKRRRQKILRAVFDES